jgi:D-ribulokinase
MDSYFIGVDVGTGSARAGVFNARGQLLGTARRDIALYREAGTIAEQSSRDIRSADCGNVRAAVSAAGIDPGSIGFDTTCSLVVLGAGEAPLSVGPHEVHQPSPTTQGLA